MPYSYCYCIVLRHISSILQLTFLRSSFPCVGEDFLENTIVVINCEKKVTEEEVVKVFAKMGLGDTFSHDLFM